MGVDKRAQLQARVRALVAHVPGFPTQRVRFRDISPILEQDPTLFRELIDAMIEPHRDQPPDVIACVESWGYLFGAPMAYELASRIALIRRAGKLPRTKLSQPYSMGYALNLTMEMHASAIQPSDRVLIVDDMLATGGTADGAYRLVAQTGARIIGLSFAVEIEGIRSRARLEAHNVAVTSVISIS